MANDGNKAFDKATDEAAKNLQDTKDKELVGSFLAKNFPEIVGKEVPEVKVFEKKPITQGQLCDLIEGLGTKHDVQIVNTGDPEYPYNLISRESLASYTAATSQNKCLCPLCEAGYKPKVVDDFWKFKFDEAESLEKMKTLGISTPLIFEDTDSLIAKDLKGSTPVLGAPPGDKFAFGARLYPWQKEAMKKLLAEGPPVIAVDSLAWLSEGIPLEMDAGKVKGMMHRIRDEYFLEPHPLLIPERTELESPETSGKRKLGAAKWKGKIGAAKKKGKVSNILSNLCKKIED